jgi:hypothetical protein
MFLIFPLFLAARPQWQDGVMVQKKGSSYIFIFPTNRLMTPSQNLAGEITIGNSIAVIYALKVLRSSRTRFIGLDGSTLSAEEFAKLKPRLSTTNASNTFGFMVRDSIQPTMNIYIEPSFMAGKIDTQPLEQRIARQGNLTVVFGATKSGQLRILQAILD